MRQRSSYSRFLNQLSFLHQAIQRGEQANCYLFHGEEEYLIQQAAADLANLLVPVERQATDLVVCDCGRQGIEPVLAFLAGEGLLFSATGKSVLLAKNLFASASRVEGGDVSQRLIEALGYGIPPRRAMIATVMELLRPNSRLLKCLSEVGEVVAAPKIASEEDFLTFLGRRARQFGVSASEEVLREVLLRVGGDIRQLGGEMAKLSTYAGSGGSISVEEVRELVSVSAEESAFRLVEYVTRKNLKAALAVLDELIRRRVPESLIIGALGQEYRRLLQGQAVFQSGKLHPGQVRQAYHSFRRELNRGQSEQLAALFPSERRDNLFKQHPYVIYRTLQNCLRCEREGLVGGLADIVRTDYQLKSSSIPASRLLEQLTVHLCQ